MDKTVWPISSDQLHSEQKIYTQITKSAMNISLNCHANLVFEIDPKGKQ